MGKSNEKGGITVLLPEDELQKRLLLWRKDAEAGKNGIGEQGEKTLHAMLKAAYAPDPANREVKVGRFVADVFDGGEIVEIQTANFRNLQKKLPVLLETAPVRLVYPMPGRRYLCWVEPDTGEMSPPRNCGCRTKPVIALHELYAIKEWLLDPRLTVELQFYDLDEYRLRCGYSRDGKKGARRMERFPRQLRERIPLSCPADYAGLLPANFRGKLPDPDRFTAADLSKALAIRGRKVYSVLHVMEEVGIFGRLPEDEQSGRAGEWRLINL